MAAKKKTPERQSPWKHLYPANGPEQYTMGAYTVIDGSPKAVLYDGRVIGYCASVEEAQALAECHAEA